ncbi:MULTISPECIES: ABC transporter permease subunit [unclassified Idiomarina]|jgi:cationic peptide transport system permease protein|uniref:ABC transporter permease subunit n=1 Tax=unclassified Idiomarina TaxID=2614829 RepID=UPI000C94E848|nr:MULTISPECIES: ABC transporter permease subunit [unclassified Idiomarina]MAD54390.1 peptide ABC transporter permease [Idiomarinaceae bacterium]MEC7642407.1 ABC transporter permease subunit [Pseudomonadota bacterium]NQZ03938.1 ABC transporter permease subunit [Idiomarina sp.]|tara:strand:+ start:2357 stop:3250 length:894 start_codon:yes stop_codon:yes gene_type:complete
MADIELYYQERNPSPLQLVWFAFKRRLAPMISLWLLGSLLILVILAPVITPYSANVQFVDAISLPPSWTHDGNMQFLFGTDDLGRDMLSRLLIGGRFSFGLPIVIVILASTVGIFIGAMVGADTQSKLRILGRTLDRLLTIPSFLLALVLIAILGAGLGNAIIAITLSLIPQFIYVTRNAVYQEWQKDYVTASRLNGCSNTYLMYRVILPNITPSLVMQLTVALSVAIMDIAALSFLGLGVQSPTPEWGSMLARSLDEVYLSPWSMVLPGISLFITIMAINVVGDSLRRAIKQRMDT